MGVGAGLYMCDVVKKVHVRYLISWWVLVITRRPCCRREPPRDAGHSCGKLAPNPGATHWRSEYRNNTKPIGKHREVVEKPLTGVSVKDWCMSPVAAWYHGSPGPKFTKFGEYVSIGKTPNATKYRYAPDIVMLRQNVCKISVVENFSPRKSRR